MKIVKLMGGLGNQMFQYAFAKNFGSDVFFDINWFANNYNELKQVKHLNLEIENFNIKYHFATEEQINNCLKESYWAKKFNNVRKIIGINIFKSNRVYEKVRNKYQSNIFNQKEDVYYDGYFQHPKYFERYREELLREFTLKKELTIKNAKMLENILNSNSVAVSIRHGKDYEALGWALEREYYEKAMKLISEKYVDIKFFIFTDNENWCKNNLEKRYNLIYSSSNDEECGYACGIELMRNCKHNIISNSTYPWWGAWLNNNVVKTVIAPKIWLPAKGLIKVTYEGLIDNNWTKI